METKISKLRAAWSVGDRVGALTIAAKFPRLGADKRVIVTAYECIKHPGFYAKLGRDEASLIAAGYAALASKYGLHV